VIVLRNYKNGANAQTDLLQTYCLKNGDQKVRSHIKVSKTINILAN